MNKSVFLGLSAIEFLLFGCSFFLLYSKSYLFGASVGVLALLFLSGRILKQRAKHCATPLPLAYKEQDGRLTYLSYLDCSRCEDVFGIKIGETVWNITEYRGGYEQVLKLFSDKPSAQAVLDTSAMFVWIKLHLSKKAFNETVMILQDNGVRADLLADALYWTTLNVSEDYAVVYNMTSGGFNRCPKCMEDIHIRLFVNM